MVTFQYPPFHGSSAVNRTFHFTRHLPSLGWSPSILSVHTLAYRHLDYNQMSSIPPDVRVVRTFGLDAARHLSIRGFYPLFLALPDPWWSWWVTAVPRGLRLIQELRPDVIWSTFPIPTAHLIALTLQRLSGIPWVADFRDPMTEEGYPTPLKKWKVHRWIERRSVERAEVLVFTTAGAKRVYGERYSGAPESKWAVIENGYEEEDFAALESADGGSPPDGRPFVLLHSGTLYPWERDPDALFTALAHLRRNKVIEPLHLRVILRGTGHDEHHRRGIRHHGLEDMVRLEPALPYRDAIAEMLRADALLLLQASNCNQQVPAKAYEYMRSRRPILALTDPSGDTAAVLRRAGVHSMVPLDSVKSIAEFLPVFLESCRRGTAPVPDQKTIAAHSRRQRSLELARVLDSAAGRRAGRVSTRRKLASV